jgi:hypothetical protein
MSEQDAWDVIALIHKKKMGMAYGRPGSGRRDRAGTNFSLYIPNKNGIGLWRGIVAKKLVAYLVTKERA